MNDICLYHFRVCLKWPESDPVLDAREYEVLKETFPRVLSRLYPGLDLTGEPKSYQYEPAWVELNPAIQYFDYDTDRDMNELSAEITRVYQNLKESLVFSTEAQRVYEKTRRVPAPRPFVPEPGDLLGEIILNEGYDPKPRKS